MLAARLPVAGKFTDGTDGQGGIGSLVLVRTPGRPPAHGYMLCVVVPVTAGSAGRA
jgi:hypothetical protein